MRIFYLQKPAFLEKAGFPAYYFLIIVSGLTMSFLLNSCGNDKGSFIISPPTGPITSGILTANPGVVETGGTSTISVSLDSIPVPPQNLAFTWAAQRGAIDGNGSIVLYFAPSTPGDDTVSVEVVDVSSPVGTQVIATESITLTIILPPTPTPVGSPTPSLTPTPGVTPTPVGSATPSPTPVSSPTPTPTP